MATVIYPPAASALFFSHPASSVIGIVCIAIPQLILLELWLHRNARRHGERFKSVNYMIFSILSYLRLLPHLRKLSVKSAREAQFLQKLGIPVQWLSQPRLIMVRWHTPPPGRNCYGASRGNPGTSGGGGPFTKPLQGAFGYFFDFSPWFFQLGRTL